MIICESEFDPPDRDDPNYSFCEIDYYAWIPHRFHKKHGNHRLTLRKNLINNKYELIKVFMKAMSGMIKIGEQNAYMTTNMPTNNIKVHFAHEDLAVVLQEGDGLWNYYHGTVDYKRDPDVVCEHKYPNRAMGCKVK